MDTIIAIQEVANAFTAQYIPLVVSCYLFFQPNDTNNGKLFWTLQVILTSNIISGGCITFLIFVNWKKGPDWWLKISHFVFYVMLLMNYIIVPLINVLISIFYIVTPLVNLKSESIETYIIFFTVVCIMRIIEYFILIRRTVLLDAKVHLQNK